VVANHQGGKHQGRVSWVFTGIFGGDHYETSTPSIPSSGSGRRRYTGSVAHCVGASLSGAPGAADRRLSRRRNPRHRSAPDGSTVVERLGQPFVIENRPGAGGNIATEAAVNAPPDGYTLLIINEVNAINATLYEKLNFNFMRDIAPVASIVRVPNVMEVGPSVPVTSVLEFISYVKANPGKLNMASGGNGTPAHVSGELFKMMTGVNMVHVPYRGGPPALADMLGGQVQVMFSNVPQTIGYIKAGKLRPLAVTTAERLDAFAGHSDRR
jgi:hypothetical protein